MTWLRKGPWWLGLAVMFLGAVCFYASTELAATAQYAAIGPGMFVAGVGLGLIGLGMLLLIQIARGEVFEPDEAENAAPGQAMDKRAFFTALLAAVSALPNWTKAKRGRRCLQSRVGMLISCQVTNLANSSRLKAAASIRFLKTQG